MHEMRMHNAYVPIIAGIWSAYEQMIESDFTSSIHTSNMFTCG